MALGTGAVSRSMEAPVRVARSVTVRLSWVLVIAGARCGAGPSAAPGSRLQAQTYAPVGTVPEVKASASTAPSPPPDTSTAPEPADAPKAPPSFVIKNASTRYDFHLAMNKPCEEETLRILDACA